jgi:hypothetical protein
MSLFYDNNEERKRERINDNYETNIKHTNIFDTRKIYSISRIRIGCMHFVSLPCVLCVPQNDSKDFIKSGEKYEVCAV